MQFFNVKYSFGWGLLVFIANKVDSAAKNK